MASASDALHQPRYDGSALNGERGCGKRPSEVMSTSAAAATATSSSNRPKKKSVRMSLDFGGPEEFPEKKHEVACIVVDEASPPSPPPPTGAQKNFSSSEIDPELVLVASIFVEELLRRAIIEVDAKFGGGNVRRRRAEGDVEGFDDDDAAAAAEIEVILHALGPGVVDAAAVILVLEEEKAD